MITFKEWKALQDFDPRGEDELCQQVSEHLRGLPFYDEAVIEVPISSMPLRPRIREALYNRLKRAGWPHVEFDDDNGVTLILKDLHKGPE